jgi:hypothetical protein
MRVVVTCLGLWGILLCQRALSAGTDLDRPLALLARTLRYTDGEKVSQITVNAQPVTSAVLTRTTWSLKNPSQSADANSAAKIAAMKLPESERLKTMNRFDDCVQIWAVPQQGKPSDWKKLLTPAAEKHRAHRETFFLGTSNGRAWYGFMPIYDFAMLEQKLALGGEDVLPPLIRGLAIDEDQQVQKYAPDGCMWLLSREADRAIPAIDKAIADRLPQRSDAIMAMLYIPRPGDKKVTQWLISLLASKDVAVAESARFTLLASPRKEAADLYVKWLAERAGKRTANNELIACQELMLKEAGPSLKKILAAPASLSDYGFALEMTREFAGKRATTEAMTAALSEIERIARADLPDADQKKAIDEAVTAVLAAGDNQFAASAGLALATCFQGRRAEKASAVRYRAGMEIVKRVPDGEGKRLARLIAQHNQVERMRDSIKAVLRELELPDQ